MEEKADTGSEVSEWELRRTPGAGRRAEGGGGGAGCRVVTTAVLTRPTLLGIGGGGVGVAFQFSFVISFVISLVRIHHFLG